MKVIQNLKLFTNNTHALDLVQVQPCLPEEKKKEKKKKKEVKSHSNCMFLMMSLLRLWYQKQNKIKQTPLTPQKREAKKL